MWSIHCGALLLVPSIHSVEHLHCGYAVLATSTEQIRTSTGYFILYSGTLIHTFLLLYYLCASPFLRQYSMAYTLSNEEKLKRVLNEVLGYAGKQGNAALSFLDKLGFLCGDDAALTLQAFQMKLEGEARAWFRRQPEHIKTQWEDLRARFIQEYVPSSFYDALSKHMMERRQLNDESVRSFHYTLEEMARKLGSHSPDQSKICRLFRSGLHLRIRQRFKPDQLRHDYNDLEDLLDTAKLIEEDEASSCKVDDLLEGIDDAARRGHEDLRRRKGGGDEEGVLVSIGNGDEDNIVVQMNCDEEVVGGGERIRRAAAAAAGRGAEASNNGLLTRTSHVTNNRRNHRTAPETAVFYHQELGRNSLCGPSRIYAEAAATCAPRHVGDMKKNNGEKENFAAISTSRMFGKEQVQPGTGIKRTSTSRMTQEELQISTTKRNHIFDDGDDDVEGSGSRFDIFPADDDERSRFREECLGPSVSFDRARRPARKRRRFKEDTIVPKQIQVCVDKYRREQQRQRKHAHHLPDHTKSCRNGPLCRLHAKGLCIFDHSSNKASRWCRYRDTCRNALSGTCIFQH